MQYLTEFSFTLRENMAPLVSVVMPVYNHENYVEEALDSVALQTYQNIELIVIDDGSKDRSVSKIEAWVLKNPKIRVTFIPQTNRGAHNTINRGLKMAQGKYLTVLNSDDFYHVRRIELLVQKMEREEGQFIFSRVHLVDATGKSFPRGSALITWYEKALAEASDPTIGFKFLRHNIAISTGNFFFTKELFDQVGEFNSFRFNHDYDFVLRSLLITEPLFLNDELYFYRFHSDNTILSVGKGGLLELAEIYRKFLVSASKPHTNKLAPSVQNWPAAYIKHRIKFELDRFLKGHLEGNETPEKSALTLEPIAGKKEKITLISQDLSISGGPRLLSDVALTLKQQGYRVNVIALCKGPLAERLKNFGIPVTVIPYIFNFWDYDRFKVRRALKLMGALAIVWAKSGRKVLANTTLAWPLAVTSALAFPWKRLYWYIHESFGPEALIPGGLAQKLFHRILRSKRVAFWFGSKATRDVWKGFNVKGSVVYWSGREISAEASKERPIKTILSVGTAEPRKGFHILVEAFIKLIEEKRVADDVTLILVGFSDRSGALQKFGSDLILKIVNAGLLGRIQLLSKVTPEQVDKIYARADLFVQASFMECLPLTLLQAMSKGMPIVCAAVDGCLEAIEHKVSGYLCLPRNVQALADSMEYAIYHPKESWVCGQKAKLVFDAQFSKEATESVLLQQISC